MLAFEPGMADSGINMNTPAADIAESLGLNIGRTSGLEADRKVWENLRVFLLISRYRARLRLDRLLRDKNLMRKAFDEHRKSQVRMKVLRRAKSELSTLDTTKLTDGILDWIMFRLINSVKKRVGRTGPPYPAADREGLSRERSAPSLSSTEENQGGALPTQNSDGRHPKLDVNFITNPGITDDDTGERA
jgi:hypothetical protein